MSPDPIFAAMDENLRLHTAFIARCMFEDDPRGD
jgi:hypothetical protein